MYALSIDLSAVPPTIRPVIANHLLNERPVRDADYKAELEASTYIVKALRETPSTVLTKLSEAVMQLTGADSAGVSLSGRSEGQQVFLWQATVGLIEKYLGSVVIHDESPCGCVLETDAMLLMVDPGKVYKTAEQIEPPIRELLLVPFHVEGRTVGTVWVVSQSEKIFDAEHARLVTNISELAALAYQTLIKIGDLELLNKTVQVVADSRFVQREMQIPRPLA